LFCFICPALKNKASDNVKHPFECGNIQPGMAADRYFVARDVHHDFA
jgi:hypothetical protein